MEFRPPKDFENYLSSNHWHHFISSASIMVCSYDLFFAAASRSIRLPMSKRQISSWTLLHRTLSQIHGLTLRSSDNILSPLFASFCLPPLLLKKTRSHSVEKQASTNYKEAFSLFDKRGNGRVSLESLGDLLRACGQNPTLAEIRDLEKTVGGDCAFQGGPFFPNPLGSAILTSSTASRLRILLKSSESSRRLP